VVPVSVSSFLHPGPVLLPLRPNDSPDGVGSPGDACLLAGYPPAFSVLWPQHPMHCHLVHVHVAINARCNRGLARFIASYVDQLAILQETMSRNITQAHSSALKFPSSILAVACVSLHRFFVYTTEATLNSALLNGVFWRSGRVDTDP
jgi:hypothetical protein